MQFALSFLAIGVSIAFFAVKVGIKLIIAIVKGIIKLCKTIDERHYENLRKESSERNLAPREEAEAIEELRRNIEEQQTLPEKDIPMQLVELLFIAEEIDKEALLIQQPKTIEENERREEARAKLNYVRKNMYEIVKFKCTSIPEFEKDYFWNCSWNGIDSTRATDAEKLDHAMSYIKLCGGRLLVPDKLGLDEQLEKAIREQEMQEGHIEEFVK